MTSFFNCFSQVIADNVGDNVGDIAGMGSDLFGSFAESTCAALVISSLSSIGQTHNLIAMLFPLFVSAAGIFVCLITTFFATNIFKVNLSKEIEPALKLQLIISTVIMTPAILLVAYLTLPSEFTITVVGATPKLVKWWCVNKLIPLECDGDSHSFHGSLRAVHQAKC